MSKDEDIEEFKEVMNTIKETVPQLIKSIVDTVYSSQSAEEFGKQVANFYRNLVEAGMDKDQAYQLTKEFMESRDIGGLIKKVLSRGDWTNLAGKNPEQLAKDIKIEIEKEKSKGEE